MDIDLGNMGLGAVQEKFEDEMKKVIENVLDPNTDAKTLRGITINVKIKPNPENREACSMEVVVSSKLAPTKTLESILMVGMSTTGEVNAIESVPQQGNLFPETEEENAPRKLHQING